MNPIILGLQKGFMARLIKREAIVLFSSIIDIYLQALNLSLNYSKQNEEGDPEELAEQARNTKFYINMIRQSIGAFKDIFNVNYDGVTQETSPLETDESIMELSSMKSIYKAANQRQKEKKQSKQMNLYNQSTMKRKQELRNIKVNKLFDINEALSNREAKSFAKERDELGDRGSNVKRGILTKTGKKPRIRSPVLN